MVKTVTIQAEKRARKVDKSRGEAANDASVSEDGAKDAQAEWGKIKDKMLAWTPFYKASFAERFFIMESPDALPACLTEGPDKAPSEEVLGAGPHPARAL